MTAKERTEHTRLQRAWATGKATKKQIMQVMQLMCDVVLGGR